MQDGSVGFILAESREKLEKFLMKSNYNGDTLIGVLDDETHGYLKGVVKSWPFGLEEKTLTHLKAYHFPGKAEDIMQWYIELCTYFVLTMAWENLIGLATHS